MALTVTISQFGPSGNMNRVVGTLAFDASYPTGGESLTAANVGLASAYPIKVQPYGGYVFDYDATNSKVRAYRQTDPADTGGADVALVEVADTTDLSALTAVPFEALGF